MLLFRGASLREATPGRRWHRLSSGSGSNRHNLYAALALLACGLQLGSCGEEATDLTATEVVVDERVLATFEPQITSTLTRLGVPGAVVIVVAQDDLLFARPFGWRNVEKQQEMTGRTLFRVGASEAFTSTLISTLIDDNHLEWETELAQVLPPEVVAGRSGKVLDLLAVETRPAAMGIPAPAADASLLRGLAEGEPFDRPRWVKAASLMAATVFHGSGDRPRETLHHLMQSKVFGPAGMTMTALGSDLGAISEDFATAYGPGQLPLPQLPLEAGSEADFLGLPLVATAPDLARFLILHIQGGIAQSGKRVSSPNNLAETRRPRHRLTPEEGEFWTVSIEAGRGMGWVAAELPWGGYHYDGISSGVPGYSLELGFLPQVGIGLVLINNLDPAAGGQACNAEIRDFFLKTLLTREEG